MCPEGLAGIRLIDWSRFVDTKNSLSMKRESYLKKSYFKKPPKDCERANAVMTRRQSVCSPRFMDKGEENEKKRSRGRSHAKSASVSWEEKGEKTTGIEKRFSEIGPVCGKIPSERSSGRLQPPELFRRVWRMRHIRKYQTLLHLKK